MTPPPVLRPRLSELVELAEELSDLGEVALPTATVTALCGALAAAVEALEEYGEHDAACPVANPVTAHQEATCYAATGRLPHDDECDCGLDAALAHINQLVDTEGSGQ